MHDWRSKPAPSCRGCFPGRSVSIWKKSHPQSCQGSTMNRRDVLQYGMASLAATTLPIPAFAAFPERPIKLIVPFSPGGATDVVGRLWAERMKAKFGTVVTE